jgi:hypothetical protein
VVTAACVWRPTKSLFTLAALASIVGACATTPPPASRSGPVPAAPPVLHTFSVAALYPVASARSVADRRAVTPGLVGKLHVDAAVMLGGADTSVEPWLGRHLFGWLVRRDAEVHAAVDGSSASLVGVRFVRVTEHPAVRVERGADGTFALAYRTSPDEPSVCAADLKVPVDWVQFEAALVAAGGRTVAVFAEATAVQPQKMTATLTWPVDADPCAALAVLFDVDRGAFAPGEAELTAETTCVDRARRRELPRGQGGPQPRGRRHVARTRRRLRGKDRARRPSMQVISAVGRRRTPR